MEAACLADDAVGFRRVLDNWAKSDVWLKGALSDKELLNKVSGDLMRMFQSVRSKRARRGSKKDPTNGKPATTKTRRQQPPADTAQNLH